MTDPIDPDHHASRPPPFPRWVIWLGIGVLVAVLLVLGLHLLTGGGMVNHGSSTYRDAGLGELDGEGR